MFLNIWSLALTMSSVVVLFLLVMAVRTAVRVLRNWNPASDDNTQIRLESEIWLSSTLVAYALGFQILTLILFVVAADQFSGAIVGAMCATGSLLANDYGIPALVVKLVGVFFYGAWILLHQLDIRSERYPLVRVKYIYLLILFPLLLVDIALQSFYIGGLKPDIITSCCAVVFSGSTGGGTNLISDIPLNILFPAFYGTAGVLLFVGLFLIRRWYGAVGYLYGAGWLWFFLVALVMLTTVVSSYIYAMPYHKCPFCILKPEYNYIGFVLYGTLIPAAFFGMSTVVSELVYKREGLAQVVRRFQRKAVQISLVLLVFFTLLASYHYLLYQVRGGEW